MSSNISNVKSSLRLSELYFIRQDKINFYIEGFPYITSGKRHIFHKNV